MKKFQQIMNPYINSSTEKEMDLISLRSIHMISLIALVFEAFASIVFLASTGGNIDDNALVSIVSVNASVLLCAAAHILSKMMLQREDFPHSRFFIFKLVFYLVFTSTSILYDFRNYMASNQMVTFYVVNLLMISFIIFRPWIGALLITCSYASMLICMYSFDGGAHIDSLNFFLLAMASIATSLVRFHSLVEISSNTVRLAEDNVVLETASRHDGLTNLLNRFALEDYAHKADGRKMAIYMIDINYFKEINDKYGHLAGDEILRETSKILKQLYPEGQHYRYGGDEFLVITYHPFDKDYAPDTYEFTQDQYGVNVLLSIGNAQGSPANYTEFFDLISSADKALYIVKKRTHSVEYGGHDRRGARQ